MLPQLPINVLPPHQLVWERLQQQIERKRVPQALLFVGSRQDKLIQLINRLMITILCQSTPAPCAQCAACQRVLHQTHPDIYYLQPMESSHVIKIEQIRDLQQAVFQTPQRGEHSFVVIDPAEKLNQASANALLKLLEEPPAHAVFILIAENISTLLPTILSRCQKWVVASVPGSNGFGTEYPPDTPRGKIRQAMPQIIEQINGLLTGKISACLLASKWADYPLEDLAWGLYWLTGEVITQHLRPGADFPEDLKGLTAWVSHTTPISLFSQLDKINALMRNITHTINSNPTLVLEDILMGYAHCGQESKEIPHGR